MAGDVPPPPEPHRPIGPPPKRHWWQGYVAPLSEEERLAALADPGPSWTEFLLWQYLKWIFGLFALIIDSLLIVSFLHPFAPGPLVLFLAVALYLEFLLWSYLWHRPPLQGGNRRPITSGFQRTWYRPFAYGRWTPEARMVAEGVNVESPETTQRKEFL